MSVRTRDMQGAKGTHKSVRVYQPFYPGSKVRGLSDGRKNKSKVMRPNTNCRVPENGVLRKAG